MKKKIRIMFAMILLILPTFFITTPLQAAALSGGIENGIAIGNVDVSSMTKEGAATAVEDYIAQLKDKTITLDAKNGNTVAISGEDLMFSWTNKEVVEDAFLYAKSGNIVKRYKEKKDLANENIVLDLKLDFNKEVIRKVVSEDCEKFNVPAKDATLTRENDEFVIVDGLTGVVIDVDASVKAITEYLQTNWDGQDCTIDLVVKTEEPRGTKEELSKIKDVLGTFTTNYKTSGSNRAGNVNNGCRLINGTLLYPGDEFSAYNAVSPFTEANGYYLAGSYLNGLVVDSLGGGICQVSTTLYNAALRAELDVTERSNHSMIVTYVDPAADAAISGTHKDLKFVNNSKHPIYIEGITQDRKLTFTIYGIEERPSNREVTYESVQLSRTEPVGEKVVADGGQPIGYVDVQSAHVGYVAELWKVVKVDGVEESRTLVNKSTYKPSPRTGSFGIASADPNATAAMQAAIATGSIDYCRAVAASLIANPAAAAAQAQAAQIAATQAAQAAAAAQAAKPPAQ